MTAKSLKRYEPGTPWRTVLEWWKAVKFADPAVVHSYYAPHRGPSLAELQHRLAIASNQFAGIPDFDSTEARETGPPSISFDPSRRFPTPRAVSINLVRTGKRWALADDQLLAQVVERVESASGPSSG